MAIGRKVEELSEYESDSEDSVLQLTLRRREASDDDEFVEANFGGRRFGSERTVGVCSEGESDGIGGAPKSDSEEESVTEEGNEFEKENEVEELGLEEFQGREEESVEMVPVRSVIEKKEVKMVSTEPCVIPTVGNFYMHDDRVRGYVGRRRNRNLGGRHSKHFEKECKWAHDKFEELTLQLQEEITTKGHNQVCSNNQGRTGYVHGNQSRRVVRGRGPVKYRPNMWSSNISLPAKDQRNGSFMKMKSSTTTSARVHSSDPSSILPTYNAECSQSSARRSLRFSAHQSTSYSHEFDRVQQRPVENILGPYPRVSTEHRGLGYGNRSQAMSPNPFERAELPSPLESESGVFKPALVRNRGSITQESETSSLLYDGTHSAKNFSATPFPVKQSGSLRYGVLGSHRIPGYAAQSQLGFGNSEITSNETGATKKFTRGSRIPHKPEIVNEEFGQQQIHPRRYLDRTSTVK